MPEIDRQGGSRRTFHFIEFLQEQGWSVTFVAEYHVSGSDPYAAMLNDRGIRTLFGLSATALHPLLAEGAFDLALLTSWPIAERCIPSLRRLSPSTHVMIDTVDLHFVRSARRSFLATEPDGRPGTVGVPFGHEMVRELNTYAAADAVLTVSSDEKDLLHTLMGPSVSAFVAPDCEEPNPSPLPIADRTGLVFVGNFLYPANTDAVAFLCQDILPRVDPVLLSEHPVSIVGNGLNDTVRRLADGRDDVRMIGWVEDLRPYLHRARAAVVPLRYGAGTKRKLIEALMAGCPTVSTSIGAEGLSLHSNEHLLIADTPDDFADAITRLLREPALAERLSAAGHARIAATHGRASARASLLDAVSRMLSQSPKTRPLAGTPLDLTRRLPGNDYDRLVERVREVACTTLPPEATVIVVSRGDDRLLALEGRTAWHFPQTVDGAYAGSYPVDGQHAILEIEALRARGADHLLFPGTALWWLDHYVVLKQHLERHYPVVLRHDGVCLIFALQPGTEAGE